MDEEWYDDEERVLTGRQKAARVVIAAILLALAAMWIYVLLPTSRRDHPALLESDDFPEAAEPVCAAAVAVIDELPLAQETETPEARGAVIEQANITLNQMIIALRPLVPPAGEDAARISEWLDDWQTYVGDRTEFAEALQGGDAEARFTEAPKEGSQLTTVIDTFADVNDMPSCATPGDVA